MPPPPILQWPQLLAEVGRHLYGEVSWQRQLAEALQHPHLPYQGVDPQTLKKWLKGRWLGEDGQLKGRDVPWWVANDLLRLVREVSKMRKEKEEEVEQGLLTELIRSGQA